MLFRSRSVLAMFRELAEDRTFSHVAVVLNEVRAVAVVVVVAVGGDGGVHVSLCVSVRVCVGACLFVCLCDCVCECVYLCVGVCVCV